MFCRRYVTYWRTNVPKTRHTPNKINTLAHKSREGAPAGKSVDMWLVSKRGGLFISQVPNPPLSACATEQQQWVWTSWAYFIRICLPTADSAFNILYICFIPYPQNPQGHRGGRLGGLLRSLVSPMTSNKNQAGDESGAWSLNGGKRSGSQVTGGKDKTPLRFKVHKPARGEATSSGLLY